MKSKKRRRRSHCSARHLTHDPKCRQATERPKRPSLLFVYNAGAQSQCFPHVGKLSVTKLPSILLLAGFHLVYSKPRVEGGISTCYLNNLGS